MANTITAYTTFVPLTNIQSSQVNANFSNHRGSIIPINETTATAGTTGTYNVGSPEYSWLGGYFNNVNMPEYDTTTSAPSPATNTTSLFTTATGPYIKTLGGTATALINNPAGAIIAFGGIAAPTDWLLCNGASVSRTTYATLYAAIGTAYGTDTTTSFNVPDMRGAFLRGTDNGLGRDVDASSRTASKTGGNTGDTVGSYQTDAVIDHDHAWAGFADGNSLPNGTTSSYRIPWESVGGAGAGTYPGVSTLSSSETRPININVNYIIKY